MKDPNGAHLSNQPLVCTHDGSKSLFHSRAIIFYFKYDKYEVIVQQEGIRKSINLLGGKLSKLRLCLKHLTCVVLVINPSLIEKNPGGHAVLESKQRL